jgi:disulfide bond formation protein DsbB
MTGSQRGPAARRSNVRLLVFLILGIVGFLMAVVGYNIQRNNFEIGSDTKYVGLLLVVIGIIGAITSAIVKATQRSRAPQIQPPFGTAASAAPGWYPDPQYPNMVRYFDGRVWTPSTQPRSS